MCPAAPSFSSQCPHARTRRDAGAATATCDARRPPTEERACQAAHVLSASTLALDADLFDFDCRVVDGRLDSFDALLGDDTDDENRDDLKGRVPGPCRREIAPAQIG